MNFNWKDENNLILKDPNTNKLLFAPGYQPNKNKKHTLFSYINNENTNTYQSKQKGQEKKKKGSLSMDQFLRYRKENNM
jgi:hypothetical protein